MVRYLLNEKPYNYINIIFCTQLLYMFAIFFNKRIL